MEDDAPPGVPEWVVTYGDMMSLLLTFFIMLVSMSEIIAEQRYRAVLESLHQRLGYASSPPSAPGDSYPLNSFIKRAQEMKLGSFTDEDTGTGGVRLPSSEGQQNRVFTGPEGVGRRAGEPLFFDGAGELLDVSVRAASEVAVDLRGKPNKIEVRSWIELEDDRRPDQVRTAYARARRVADFLSSEGVQSRRIRLAVVPAGRESGVFSGDVSRNGAVTIAVLDVFDTDFAGRDESAAYR